VNESERKAKQKAIRDGHAELRALRGEGEGVQPSKRLTVTEVARTLLDRAPRSAHGSVTLTWNAKGDTQINVEVPTSDELPTIAAASEAAQKVYDALRGAYPRGEV
jgi:hypothetical protein